MHGHSLGLRVQVLMLTHVWVTMSVTGPAAAGWHRPCPTCFCSSHGLSMLPQTPCLPKLCVWQARLELEVQRLSNELSAAERKLELTAADLAAERDRVAAHAAMLECKVRIGRLCVHARHHADMLTVHYLCWVGPHICLVLSLFAAYTACGSGHAVWFSWRPAFVRGCQHWHPPSTVDVLLLCVSAFAAREEAALEGGLPRFG